MPKMVLIVEDYEDTRQFMRFLVETYGYNVIEAAEVLAADLPRAQMPDLAPVAPRGGDGAGVRRLAGVPAARPRRIRFGVEPQPLGLGPERRLGERRAADIA